MNEIFDINKLPNRRLSVRKTIARNTKMPLGEALCMVKEDMAHQLAMAILDNEPFFWKRDNKLKLEYGADCIVLTVYEYVQLKQEAFSDGVTYAQGFTSKSSR